MNKMWMTVLLSALFIVLGVFIFPAAGHTNENPLPFMVDIFDTFANASKCGGSIITIRHVLTAFHCVDTQSLWPNYLIIAGTFNIYQRNDRIQLRKIQSVVQYLQSSIFDLAVIVLEKKFQMFNPLVKPIKLAPQGFSPKAGLDCVLAGWGFSQEIPQLLAPENLKILNVQTYEKRNCKAGPVVERSNEYICAGVPGNTSQAGCVGDSGSPLFLKDAKGEFLQIGVLLEVQDPIFFMASISCKSENKSICGDSIIAIKYVLTAFHCVEDFDEWPDLIVKKK